MKNLFGALLLTTVLCTTSIARQATEANPVLEKAITALGGAEKLEKIKSISWKAKGTLSFQGMESPMSTTVTVQGLNFAKQEFEAEFGGNQIKGVSVLAGDKGWRSFAGNKMPLENMDDEKRNLSLTVLPITLVQLKGKGYKLETLPEEKLGEKPAAVLKVTPAKGKDFKIYFDKESGLPVRLVAKVTGFQGEEFTQDTTLSGYKMLGGINKATKISSKRDGEKFMDQEVTEFTTSEKEADSKLFTEPD